MVGSHPIASTPYLQSCDLVIDEPAGSGDAFIAQALDVCRRHRIDVFIPGREMEWVSRAEADFAAAGVRLQVSPASSIATLATKGTTYREAAALGVPVPAHEIVTDIQGFRQAARRLRAAGHQVCMKPDSDHGGNGFRILDEGEALLASLGRPPSVRVSQEVADQLLASVERFDPLVVSEYLPGPELSIDCLSSPAGELLAALPRSKGGLEWTRELVDDPAALDIAAALVRAFGLRYLSNVQVKYSRLSNGRPVLLEVNTRAASGLYQSCRAGGVNLPALALRLTLGEDITIPEPGFGRSMIVYNEAVAFTQR